MISTLLGISNSSVLDINKVSMFKSGTTVADKVIYGRLADIYLFFCNLSSYLLRL